MALSFLGFFFFFFALFLHQRITWATKNKLSVIVMYRNFTHKYFSKLSESIRNYLSFSFHCFFVWCSLKDVKHNACLWTTEVIVGVFVCVYTCVKHAEMFIKHFKWVTSVPLSPRGLVLVRGIWSWGRPVAPVENVTKRSDGWWWTSFTLLCVTHPATPPPPSPCCILTLLRLLSFFLDSFISTLLCRWGLLLNSARLHSHSIQLTHWVHSFFSILNMRQSENEEGRRKNKALKVYLKWKASIIMFYLRECVRVYVTAQRTNVRAIKFSCWTAPDPPFTSPLKKPQTELLIKLNFTNWV